MIVRNDNENAYENNQVQRSATDNGTELMIMDGFLCLITTQLCNNKDPIYRIITTDNVKKLMQEYPKGSICSYIFSTKNAVAIKREVLNQCQIRYTQMNEIGEEYFLGSMVHIADTIHHIVHQINTTK